MKKLILCGLFLAATSCSESTSDENESTQSEGLQITVDFISSMSNTLMKSSFDDLDKLTLLSWVDSDTESCAREDFIYSEADESCSDELLSQNFVMLYPTSLLDGIDDYSKMEISNSSVVLYSESISEVVMRNVTAQLNFSILGETPTQSSLWLVGELSNTAEFNLFTSKLTLSDPISESTLILSKSGSVSSLYSVLIIPQTLADFTLKCGDVSYLYEGDPVVIGEGEATTLFVELIAPSTDGDVGEIKIGGWDDGDSVGGTFN